MDDSRRKEIYRLLQTKGFGLPQVHCAETLINDQINDKHFKDCLLTCENCSLGECYCGEKVLGDGPITSPVMVIGDYTKEDDEETGIPFSGSAGFVLTMALQTLNIDRRCIYITNAVKCRSHIGITPDSIAMCKSYLDYEINRVNPKYIVVLGNIALKSVLNNFEVKISDYRGKKIDKSNRIILPTWHPDYLLNKTGLDYKKASEEFIKDIHGAFNIIQGDYNDYRWNLQEVRK